MIPEICPHCGFDLTKNYAIEVHEKVTSYDIHLCQRQEDGTLDRTMEDFAREEVESIKQLGVFCHNCDTKLAEADPDYA